VQGALAASSFEIALAAFDKAGLDTQDAYAAVKATALSALAVGLERAMLSQGVEAETSLDALPAEQFPHIRSMAEVTDPEAAWSFSLETLVSGLRAQVRRRRSAG